MLLNLKGKITGNIFSHLLLRILSWGLHPAATITLPGDYFFFKDSA